MHSETSIDSRMIKWCWRIRKRRSKDFCSLDCNTLFPYRGHDRKDMARLRGGGGDWELNGIW